MNKATVKDINLNGKKILVRVDFNVPIKDGKITDNLRIREALPTINYLLEHNCTAILMSHMGRPKGKVVEDLRLNLVGEELSKLLERPVLKLNECIGAEVEEKIKGAKSGDVILLENLRFHPEEEKNDPEFAKKLASLGEIYVNDAFGSAHRAHASTEGVAHYLPAVSGFLMEKELQYLGRALENPERPFIALLGGAKVSDKIGVIDNLIGKVDAILIGGGMAFTFLKAKGYEIGKSILDEKIDLAKELMKKAEEKGIKFILPVDVIVTKNLEKIETYDLARADKIPKDEMGVDIGPDTINEFLIILKDAKTVVWNGPMGVFEMPEFAEGTEEIAKALSELNTTVIIGGGDSAACIKKLGLSDKVTHVSTGGGASLEFLEGKELPGVTALLDKSAVKAHSQ